MAKYGKDWIDLSPRLGLGMGRVLSQKEKRCVTPSPLTGQRRQIILTILTVLLILTGLFFVVF